MLRFLLCIALAFLICGCERTEPVRWEASQRTARLDAGLQTQIATLVEDYSGTAAHPAQVTGADPTFEQELHFLAGQAVYMKRCVQCHGTSGGGDGPAAEFMYPRPRDYTLGIFKFTSTEYGARPRRDDLLKTIRRGIHGTSMPSFALLPEKELEAVTDYVMLLSQRGELEYQLTREAEAADELDPDFIPDLIGDVRNRWNSARTGMTQPLTPQPVFTADRVRLGREAFLTRGCSKCHGEDGRGHTKDNIGKDSWGHATRAADLTSGMLHGGQEPIDIYRRILNGINGTPMPGFRNALQEEPETIWNLVSYVLSVSNRRRELTVQESTENIPAGLIKPYAEAAATEQPAADGAE